MARRPAVLLALAVPVLFLGLAASSIWDANEAFYVETPRQMVLSGDYVNPTFNGEPRFNKPVLTYWIVAGFYNVFGVSVGVERLAIALGALGILGAAFLIGRAVRSPATGVLAALLLVSAPRIVFFARRIAIDIFVTLFMTLALACFALAERDRRHRTRYLALMYVAIGLGVLTKGPIALVIPALAVAAYLFSEGRWRDIGGLMLPTGALIVLAIVLPWYIAVYAEHGWQYIQFFFVNENLGRYASAFTTDRSPLFFVFALFGDILMPWAPLVAIPLLAGWRRAPAGDSAASIRRLLWWWVVVTVALFSFSASKEDLYILPAIPAAAVLIADLLIATGFGAAHRGVRAILSVVAVAAGVVGALLLVYLASGYYRLGGAYVLAAILMLGAGVAIALILSGRPEAGTLSLVAAFVAFNYLLVLRALPDVERLKPVPVLARAFNDRASSQAELASWNTDLPSFVYYAGRPVRPVFDLEQAAAFFEGRQEAWMLLGEREWAELARRVPASCEVARHPRFLARGSDVLRGEAPTDVVLVSAPCRPPAVSAPR